MLRRKMLSKEIEVELKRCLRDNEMAEWSLQRLRAHVSSVVDKPLHSGQARIFFNRKVQELLISKRRRRYRRKAALHRDVAVPKKSCTFIVDREQ